MMALAGGCSPERYKAKADKEVYGILKSKWKDDFGQMANYQVSDTTPTAADIANVIPPSGVLNLAQAVAIATQYSRDYRGQKESLYLSALDLTLTRYQYARQWFGTIDAAYTSQDGAEETLLDAQTGVNQNFLLGDGIQAGAALAVDWTRFLTGDPRTSLGSVLTASANVASTPETQVTRLRFHEGAYSLGLAADLPFDRKAQRNAYREALRTRMPPEPKGPAGPTWAVSISR